MPSDTRNGVTTMKAMARDAYCSPDLLEPGDVARPVPGDDDVLVRVRAAGVDHGVWHLATGLPYPVRLAGFGLLRPKTRVLGTDVAGHVEATGRNVTRFRPGDEVFGTCDGSYAEYACAPQDRLAAKPAGLTFEQAAVIPTSAFAALQGLRAGGDLAGRTVLVIGAGGGVGTFAVQFAASYGAEVTGVCGPAKAELVRSIGARHVVDHTREDVTEGAGRYDLILDTAGGRRLSRLRRVLAPRGTIVIVGAEVGGRWLGGVGRQLQAMVVSPFARQNLRALLSRANAEDLELLRGLAASGGLTPVVDRAYPLGEVPEAIRHLRSGRAAGKIVITV
ncbi:NAD(P)-dependent alcohol dehydrogenase [Sphaerisporangium corydalis]|uniref:NAD(P)-dependent alcohol dehydrogenase n=1 Tax=Sphaerisporangium corydalis TaxID=1441875 RepID=A0ABV9EBX7_9ACTN|nr:NAD(P)-dependent alcohol dehydrogenase [Sphaerisporangium corydalis]